MFQKGHPKDAFFNMKALAPRPMSDATEMFDTDFEEDSEVEDNSPRLSLGSVSILFIPSAFTADRCDFRLANEVQQHYHPLKKYIHRVQMRTSLRDSTLILFQRRNP